MKLVASVDDRYGRRQRWHEMALYQVVDDIYLLKTHYVAHWEGELRLSSVTIYDDEQAVISALEEHSLSSLAGKLLEQAAQTDAAFFAAVVQPGAADALQASSRQPPPRARGKA